MTIEDIALQMTPGIGVKGAVHLLGVFGSARDIFAAAPDELAGEAGLREEIAREIVRRRGFAAAEKELEHCRRNGIAAIASTDPEYPPLLREIPDYPHVLYIKGDTAALSARCLSMVGTRNATPYGQTMCNRLVEGLAAQVPGLCIVSGLAFGIDVAAHRAALAAGVPTVAVLANPLPEVTPAQHTAVARDILDHGGALVTELHSQHSHRWSPHRINAGLAPDVSSSNRRWRIAVAGALRRRLRPLRLAATPPAGDQPPIRTVKAQLKKRWVDDIVRELMREWATLRWLPQAGRPIAGPGLFPHGRSAVARNAFRTERTRSRRAGDAARGAGTGRRRTPAARQQIHETDMRLTDTHSHLYAPEFDADREEALARAADAGVERALLPAIDSESHERLFGLCRSHPERCAPMMGLHPTSVNDNPRWREELALVERYLETPPAGIRFCAVGEIGLDLYWSRDFRAEQLEAFRRQIDLSLEYGLPIAVHTRDAWPETVELMREYKGRGVRGVFHAFSDTADTYRELKEYGDFVFGIGGVVTFKKSKLADAVREMELRDIVLETDCPYLTPGTSPRRTQRIGLCAVRLRKSRGAERTDARRDGRSDDGQRRTHFRKIKKHKHTR